MYVLLVYTADRNCSLRDLSPSLVEHSRVCGVMSGGGVCYSGDSVGSVWLWNALMKCQLSGCAPFAPLAHSCGVLLSHLASKPGLLPPPHMHAP